MKTLIYGKNETKDLQRKGKLKIHLRILTIQNVFIVKYTKMDNNPQFHVGEKIHVCEICNETFSNGGTLIIHLWTHTSEPHGGHPTHRPRSPVRQSALNPTTNQP